MGGLGALLGYTLAEGNPQYVVSLASGLGAVTGVAVTWAGVFLGTDQDESPD